MSFFNSQYILTISLFLIDNDPVEESEEEIVDFDDDNDDDNIGFNNFNFGNIDIDGNTDTMSENSDT